MGIAISRFREVAAGQGYDVIRWKDFAASKFIVPIPHATKAIILEGQPIDHPYPPRVQPNFQTLETPFVSNDKILSSAAIPLRIPDLLRIVMVLHDNITLCCSDAPKKESNIFGFTKVYNSRTNVA